jgi:hypothetical protein
VGVELVRLGARLVVGDTDLVVVPVATQPGSELGLRRGCRGVESFQQAFQQAFDAAEPVVGGHGAVGGRLLLLGAQGLVAVGEQAETVALLGDEASEQLTGTRVDRLVLEVGVPPVGNGGIGPLAEAELLELLAVGQIGGAADGRPLGGLGRLFDHDVEAEFTDPLLERLGVLALTQRHGGDHGTDVGAGCGARPGRQVHLGVALGVGDATQQREIGGLNGHRVNIDRVIDYRQGSNRNGLEPIRSRSRPDRAALRPHRRPQTSGGHTTRAATVWQRPPCSSGSPAASSPSDERSNDTLNGSRT